MIYTVKFKKSDQFSIEVRKKTAGSFWDSFQKLLVSCTVWKSTKQTERLLHC